MKQAKLRYRFKWFRLILAGLFAYCVYLTIGQHSQLAAIARETENTRMQLEAANKTKAELTDERARLHDKGYIEKLAREDLGLVKPGEVPFITGQKNE